MGFSNVLENGLLNLLFNGTAIPNVADNAASSPLTNWYVSLHTADPGDGGDQTTNEITYSSYARVAVARTTGGWTVATVGSTSPVANIEFPVGTGGSGTAAYMGIGTDLTGTGVLEMSGPLTPNVVCGLGVQPIVNTATTITLD